LRSSGLYQGDVYWTNLGKGTLSTEGKKIGKGKPGMHDNNPEAGWPDDDGRLQ